MRKKLIFIMFLGCFFASDMYGKFHRVKSLDGPVHPLNYNVPREDLDVDSAYGYIYYQMGIEYTRPIVTYCTISRSDDGLTDTVHNMTGPAFIYNYSKDGKLISEGDNDPRYVDMMPYVYAFYEYDEEGRLTKLTETCIERPSVNMEEKILRVETFDYSTVRMTEKGYIFDKFNCEYELDELGRVTRIKYLSDEDEYVEYVNGKTYRTGDAYFSYTDSSCTSFSYARLGDMMLGAENHWVKSVYVFNEKGYAKSEIHTVSKDGKDWNTIHHYEYSYVYSTDNRSDDVTENPLVENSRTTVYAIDGGVMVVSEMCATAQIYNLYGQLVKQQPVSAGENRINVSKGLYVIVVGDFSCKVYVR